MSDQVKYRHVLTRDGQSQSQRELAALDPDYIKVDERDRDDLITFARAFSERLQYYDIQNRPAGDWANFFSEKVQADQPHYALFLAFTWLYRLLQQDLNTITKRHLDHYYKEILRLTNKPATADAVHVIVELAKNVDQYLVKKGTLLKAGKDATDKELCYAVDQDIVINKSQVSSLRTIYQKPIYDPSGSLLKSQQYGLYAAPVANSVDGIGTESEEESFGWKLLGESQAGKENPTMVKADVGFAIASPILWLKEGIRKVKLGFTFESGMASAYMPYFLATSMADKTFTKSQVIILQDYVGSELERAALSSEDNAYAESFITQLKADYKDNEHAISEGLQKETDARKALELALEASLEQELGNVFTVSLSGEEEWVGPFDVSAEIRSGRYINFSFTLNIDQPAIVAYNDEVLGEGLKTSFPVLKFMVKKSNHNWYSFLKNLLTSSVDLSVDVKGARSLVLQNDTANINPNKPFQPFGPQPNYHSNFYIGSDEIFQKKLDSFDLHLEWSDLPDDLKTHYETYGSLEESEFKAQIELLQGVDWNPVKVRKIGSTVPLANEFALFGTEMRNKRGIQVVPGKSDLSLYDRPKKFRAITGLFNDVHTGFIRVKLTGPKESDFEAFGHKRYPSLYTEKIIERMHAASEAENTDLDKKPPQDQDQDKDPSKSAKIKLPNEPYTPLLSSVAIDYSSTITVKLNELGKEHEQFFHLNPFGHLELGSNFISAGRASFIPNFSNEGTLYIGLEQLKAPQNVSVLFQLNEKRIDHKFVGKVEVAWHYLCKNQWVALDKTQIIEDTTAVFTQSGIVTFQLPKEITNDNTVLPQGQYWIRATVPANTVGIAEALSVQAQAVKATFVNKDNDPGHLENPLKAKTIKKLKESVSAIKGLSQGYASFGGQLSEKDSTFNTRVSERLRHKRRAVSVWDYERLILEAFPTVHKVKCLNHYNPEADDCLKAAHPGAVTLVIISKPDTDTTTINKLAPVTNVITLNAIEDFIGQITPPFIVLRNKLFVLNPDFCRIQIDCGIKLRPGYDQGYYLKQVNEDLMKLLSPWAFDQTRPVTFERKLYKSHLVNYLEELPYVDFVCCFKVNRSVEDSHVYTEVEAEVIEAATPTEILISANDHDINIIQGDECNCEEEETPNIDPTKPGIGTMVVGSDFTIYPNRNAEQS